MSPPGPPLTVYLLTFNTARNPVDPALLARSLFAAAPRLPDVICVCLQELAPLAHAFLGRSQLAPYFDRIADSVRLAAAQHGDDAAAYRRVVDRHLGMTAIMLFARPDVADRVRWIQTAGVGVGLWAMGNKGAVGVRMGLAPDRDSEEEVHLTFVAAHLAPMEDAVPRRIEDWENIVRNLVFEPSTDHAASGTAGSRALGSAEEEREPLISSSSSSEAATSLRGLYSPTSHVFFAGDLNFRTHDQGPSPKDHRVFPQPAASTDSDRHFSRLLATDQLHREHGAGRVLHGFEELPITFPPTYKYSFRRPAAARSPDAVGDGDAAVQEAETWAWAKHRWPSWCDRIFFLPPSASAASATFQPLKYTSLPLLPSSDHQPVALALSLSPTPLLPPEQDDDVRNRPPFPLNPAWKQQRAAARRLELAVGVLAYLALTWEGNGVLLAMVLGACGLGAVVKSFV